MQRHHRRFIDVVGERGVTRKHKPRALDNEQVEDRRTAQDYESDDLHVAPFREDGKTSGTPAWIWSVVVGDALYLRARADSFSGPHDAVSWRATSAAGIGLGTIKEVIS